MSPPASVAAAHPLRLKELMAAYHISARDLAESTRQTGGASTGRPLSPAAISQIVNHDIWPRATPRETLQEQIRALLIERGVPAEDVDRAFERGGIEITGRALGGRRKKPIGRADIRALNRPRSPNPHRYIDIPEAEMLTQAAKKHFKLFRDPFTDDVQGPEDVFLSAEGRYIRESMMQTAKHGGFMAIVGESGAGKTTLRRDLLDRIAREDLAISVIQPRVIDKTRLNASMICDAVIGDLSPPDVKPRISLEAKARQIETLLTGSSRAGNRHVLMIEEAHDLPVQTLKYLKRFYELEDGFRKLIAIILVGQPELKAKLDERQNYTAREVIRRIEMVELKPLNGDLKAYLRAKLEHQRVGARLDDIFTADAFPAIHRRLSQRMRGTDQVLSMAYPLVVNNLVRKVMNQAAETGADKIDAEQILEV